MSTASTVAPSKSTPYWWEAAPREPEAGNPAPVPETADVVVVGGGYAGLSAALTLARAGRVVVVLEAGPPGLGASSRSGGMVGHGHRLSYSKVTERHGPVKARALVNEGIAGLDHLFQLIEREGIDAKLKRVGRFRGAARPEDFDGMRREADLLNRDFDLGVQVVEKADIGREIATSAYHGGLIFPTHGGLHPALLHQGLLRVVRREANARVAAYTPMQAISREADGYRVKHSRGEIRARDVLLCTNGYSTTGGTGEVARRLVPMPSYMVATEPLGANRVGALIPNGRMIVETGMTHLYFRPSPDGERIILGGRAALHPIGLDQAGAKLKGYLAEVLPDLGPVALSHVWTGNVAMTRSDLPALGRQKDGVWYAAGCNGSGVALMTYLGHKLALKVLGDPAGATAYDDIEAPTLPLYDGRPWFLPAMTAWWRIKDRLAGR